MHDTPIRVSVVEDDSGIRAGLVRLFNQARGFQALSDYASAENALCQLPGEKPDVVLMDINLPGLNGIECVRRLKALAPSTLVVMLTVYEDTEQVFQALQAGATGYLLKRTPPKELLDAVRDVWDGGAPMTSHIARKVVEVFRTQPPVKTSDETSGLSAREKEVLDMLAQGYLVKEIADKLGVGFGTVRTYVRRIYEKLHVHSRSQAVARYLKP
jgi:DNA-binding NarL/FixJ family response regulator